MNGDEFDFDALRDPNAPRPGTAERAGVDARARQLRARSRRGRLAMSSVSIIAVVAIVAAVVASQRDNGPQVVVEGPTSTEASSIGDRFVPPTTIENGTVTLPVTLPDGETTTLTYPQGLQIAQLGFAGGIGVNWPVATADTHCCGRVVSITYDTIEHVYGKHATPITTYRGANGEAVPFFHSTTNAALDYLVFQFGPWLVQAYDVERSGDNETRMTDDQRATWARSLSGTVDDNGYLVLHATAPLSIGNGFDGGFGAGDGNSVELASHLYCDQPESDSAAHRRSTSGGLPAVSWCVGKDLHVSASGSQSFVNGADRGLQVSDLAVPSTNSTTTTTTTTPVTTGSGEAVSASFVSPDHGWVLETDGTVAETTDGGASWSRVGAVPLPSSEIPAHIRFADGSHGFVFTTEPRSGAGVQTTEDGGAHWTTQATPFSAVSDLAVSGNVVYVVGVPGPISTSGNFPGFRIFSSPVSRLHWSTDPLVIPAGAGPIPLQSLVFAGGQGWLVNNDRDLISGARLATPGGRWTEWKPPCTGGAQLAASTGHDLVLACGPAFATSAKASTIRFSHDGGATFGPPRGPDGTQGASEVLSPTAETAVVATIGSSGTNVLTRTTDGGGTWNTAATFGAGDGPVDFGFTTPTQGFVVFSNGTMLMTHDAGASWQKVALP